MWVSEGTHGHVQLGEPIQDLAAGAASTDHEHTHCLVQKTRVQFQRHISASLVTGWLINTPCAHNRIAAVGVGLSSEPNTNENFTSEASSMSSVAEKKAGDRP